MGNSLKILIVSEAEFNLYQILDSLVNKIVAISDASLNIQYSKY